MAKKMFPDRQKEASLCIDLQGDIHLAERDREREIKTERDRVKQRQRETERTMCIAWGKERIVCMCEALGPIFSMKQTRPHCFARVIRDAVLSVTLHLA